MTELFYNFTSIYLSQFAILTDSAVENGQKSISNEVNFRFDPEGNQLFCKFSVFLESMTKDPLVKAELLCGFTVKKETVESLTKDGTIVFPVEMLGHIASLSYSTLRGVLYRELENTPLQGLVLPLQNIYPYITQPYVFRLDER